jgi:hypothetical protein
MSGRECFYSEKDRRQLPLRRKPQLNNLGLIAMLSLTSLGLAAAAASAAKRPVGCSSTLLHETRPPACLGPTRDLVLVGPPAPAPIKR